MSSNGQQAASSRRARRAAQAARASLPSAMHFLSKGPEAHFQMMHAPWLLPVATLHVAAFHIQTRWRGRRLLRAARGDPLTASTSSLQLSSSVLSLPSERRSEPIHVVYERYVQRVKSQRRQRALQLVERGRSFHGLYSGSNTQASSQVAQLEQQVRSIRTLGHVEHDADLAARPKWVLRDLQPLQTLHGYCATRIAAWWHSLHSKWWFWLRFLRPRRVVYQVAALELQQVLSAWMRRRRGPRWQAAWRNRRWLHYRDMGYSHNPTKRQEMQLATHRRFRPTWVVWDYRAWQIQCLWRNYRDGRVAGFLARLVTRFNASGDTKAVLAGVAAGEALLADAASKLIVRFRLGGGPTVWPPVLLYRIGTAAPVCDVGAFAPRDYAAVQQRRAALPAQAATLKQLRSVDPRQFRAELGEAVDAALDTPLDPQTVDDIALSTADGWYQRETRNTWRMVALGKVLTSGKATQFMPDMPIPVSVSSAAGMTQDVSGTSGRNGHPPTRRKQDVPWHHDPSQRRRNRAAAHVHAKNRWIQKMKSLYMDQHLQPSASDTHMVPDDAEEAEEGGGFAAGGGLSSEGKAEGGVRFTGDNTRGAISGAKSGLYADDGGDSDDDEALLAWVGAIDLDAYDKYVTHWHAVGTTQPSAYLDSATGELEHGGMDGASRDFSRLKTTVSGPQPPPRHAPMQQPQAAAAAAEAAHINTLRAHQYEAELAELGVDFMGAASIQGAQDGYHVFKGRPQSHSTPIPPSGSNPVGGSPRGARSYAKDMRLRDNHDHVVDIRAESRGQDGGGAGSPGRPVSSAELPPRLLRVSQGAASRRNRHSTLPPVSTSQAASSVVG